LRIATVVLQNSGCILKSFGVHYNEHNKRIIHETKKPNVIGYVVAGVAAALVAAFFAAFFYFRRDTTWVGQAGNYFFYAPAPAVSAGAVEF